MSGYFQALAATWPAAETWNMAGFVLRDGAGGGKRASAATLDAPLVQADIDAAEAAMRARGDLPLFMVRGGEDDFDKVLAQRSYRIVDPTLIYACPISQLSGVPAPYLSAFANWPPMAITYDLWAQAGTDPGRIAVMERVAGPKSSLLARTSDSPAGVAFAAIHDGICMVHAMEVATTLRRQGTATNLMREAAGWARAQGARECALAVTDANTGAKALYSRLGMNVAARYHYRAAPEA